MSTAVIVLIITFLILLVLNVPVAFCMGIATVISLLVNMFDQPDLSLMVVAQKMATGIDEFSLLAIPFFILSGLFMGHGGIARRLIDFANVLVGGFRGGLAFVDIFTCMLFGSISGSAAAAVSSVGGFMVPLMNKMGYNREYNASISITAATTGLLIPPSNVMIVYSLATGGACSIAAIFIAGVIPGILVGLGLMVVAGIIAARNKYGTEDLYNMKQIMMRLVGGLLCVVIPIVLYVIRGRYMPAEGAEAAEVSGAGMYRMTGMIFIVLSASFIMMAIYVFIKDIKNRDIRIISMGFAGLFCIPLSSAISIYNSADVLASSAQFAGIIMTVYFLAIIAVLYFYGKKVSWTGFLYFVQAVPALMLIVIVLGGILKGIFTATEASAIAVVYAFLLSVFLYREVKFRDLPGIILQSAVTTAVVMMLVATSMAMSYVLASENVPQNVSNFLLSLTEVKWIILLIINMILLAVGTFMDMTPAVLIFTPIFLSIVTKASIGMDPLHFGIIMIMNLCIGLCTPPVGTCLFLGCGIAETTVTKVIKHIVPFFIAMIVTLLLCTYIPALSLWLPEKLGLIGQ